MKRAILTVGLLVLSGWSVGQSSTLESSARDIDAERAKISAQRAGLEAAFLAEDIACYKKFAVNNCLGKVDVRRRAATADLRRKELALNDEERKIKGEQSLQRIEEKSSPENLQQEADRRAKGAEDFQSRMAREKDKQRDSATAAASEQAARDAAAQRLLNSQKKAAARDEKRSAAADEVRKYEERQQQAAERRAQHEKEQLARPPTSSKPLPLPN